MLNPSLIVDATVAALQTIEPLVEAMGADPSRIKAFRDLYGVDVPLAQAVNEMLAPSIMVVFDKTQPGDWDAATQWKHHIDVYVRPANVANAETPISYEYLWWLIVNSPVNSTTLCIRKVSILPQLQIMDTPSVARLTDLDGIDYFRAHFVYPELGDN